MRICHLVYQYYPQDPRPRRAAETFAKEGHEVHVIAMRQEGEPLEEDVASVHVHRFPFPVIRGGIGRYLFQYLIFLLGSSNMLLRLHLRRSFDVIHIHSLPDFQVFSAVLEKWTGAWVVLDLHEAMPELFAARFHLSTRAWSVSLLRSVELICCLFADRILVVNETLRARIIATGLDPAKVSVVMNSPPIGSLVPHNLDALRERLGVTNRKAIVYVGGVNPERDLETLVRAVACLDEPERPALVIVGHGEESYRECLREQARRHGLQNCIVGPRVPYGDAFSYMLLSEVGPITYESNPLTELAMPTKALEYVAAGKPLVMADLKGIRSLFGDAALYYSPGDSLELARQLSRILRNPELRRELTQGASEVLANCRWDVMAARLASAYRHPSRGG